MTAQERPVKHLVWLGVIAAAVCCGVPILLAAGWALTIAGFGLRSWFVVLVGFAALVLGAWEHRRRKGSAASSAVDATASHGEV